MKKCISLIICAVLLMTMAVPMAIPAGAMGNTSTLISQASTNEYPAPDIATIEAGEAVMGELEAIKAPTLDGVISEREYREMDRIEAAQLMGVVGIEAGWNPQALKEFAEGCDTLSPYWGAGWDGKYLYLAFEVNTENIDFFNALTTDNVYLYANTCFQVGVANVDATGNNLQRDRLRHLHAAGARGTAGVLCLGRELYACQRRGFCLLVGSDREARGV